MKLRKTRIKKTTKANGSTTYSAEYKWGFWWYQFDDCMGPSGNALSSYFNYVDNLWRVRSWNINGSEAQAKEIIDFYVKRVNYNNACEMENKVMKVEYEGYP